MARETYAKLIDAVPNVSNAADRDARFPSPDTDQKVYRLDLGTFEIWDGTEWVSVISGVIPPPPLFPGWVPFQVQRLDRTFVPDQDVTQFKGTGKTYYVGFAGASDSNSGLTRALSFASLNKAYTMTDYDVIVVNAGLYDRNVSSIGTVTRSHSLIGEGGSAQLSAHQRPSSLVWTLHSGTCYKVTVGLIRLVCDARYTDAFGDYARCTLVADIATCISTLQSWYYDSGAGIVYVNLPDGRAPDSDVRCYRSQSMLTIESGIAVYLENISLEGGDTPLLVDTTTGATGSGRPTCYAKSCRFLYSGSGNVVTSRGGITWFEDCVAAHGFNDGFNYHTDTGVTCDAVEVNCESYDNGYDPVNVGINNGSTTHDGNAILRVNGIYHDNDGPNVADVNGPSSWNLGCRSYASRAVPGPSEPANYYLSGGNMWLDHCDSAASLYDFATTTGGVIYTRACSDTQTDLAGSDVQEY